MCELLERFSSWPRFVKPVNRNRNKWNLQVNRQNRGAFLKSLRATINAALTFRVEDQSHPMTQAVSAGAHGWNQIRIGIDHNHAHDPRHPSHEARAKNFTGADRKHPLERPERKHREQRHGIEKTLMIRAEQTGALFRQIFQTFDIETRNHFPEQLRGPRENKNDWVQHRSWFRDRERGRIGRILL